MDVRNDNGRIHRTGPRPRLRSERERREAMRDLAPGFHRADEWPLLPDRW